MTDAERKYEALFENVRDAVLVADTERNITDCNVAFVGIIRDVSEQRGAEQRARHLTEVLRATREVSQLVSRATDRTSLLTAACSSLIRSRGYSYAWVLLEDEEGGPRLVHRSPGESVMDELSRQVHDGYRPTCATAQTVRGGVQVTRDPLAECTACPLREPADRESLAAFTGTLEHGGHTYGHLTVSLPKELATDREEIALFRDLITDLSFGLFNLEADARIRESEERFRLLAENMPGTTYLCRNDPQWTMIYINNRVEELTGCEPEDFYRGTVELGELIHPEDRDHAYNEVQSALEAERPFHIIYRINPQDGSERWIEEFGDAVRTGGEVAYLEGLLTDITERREREQRIEALLDEKELLVREVYHRVKNNMMTVTSILSLQIDHVAPECADALQEARDRVSGMVELYEHLHHSSGTTHVEMGAYLSRTADELASTHAKPHVELKKEFEPIEVDAKTAFRLGLVFTELLTNAFKYAFGPQDTGHIQIRFVRLDSNNVRLTVRDNGRGMEAEKSAGGDAGAPASDPARTGGFGLMLVRTLVEQLEGELSIASENGTRVEMTVPLSSEG